MRYICYAQTSNLRKPVMLYNTPLYVVLYNLIYGQGQYPWIPLRPCCLLHATTMNCYLSLYVCGMQGLGNTTAGSSVLILPVMCKCCMGPICALVPMGMVHLNKY